MRFVYREAEAKAEAKPQRGTAIAQCDACLTLGDAAGARTSQRNEGFGVPRARGGARCAEA